MQIVWERGALVPCLGPGGRRCDRQLADDGHSVGVGRLPCALVFTTRVGPVDELITVDCRGVLCCHL